jgi:putative selenate reductase
VRRAAAANLAIIAEETRGDDRYRSERNRGVPKRIGSHLWLFDCVSCDKCIPVCPNDANFTFAFEPQVVAFTDWIVRGDGGLEPGGDQTLAIERHHQIANFADFCNECGNCDTFCPEYGGPFIEKPTLFGTFEAWERHADRDGFHISVSPDVRRIFGRMQGRESLLEQDRRSGGYAFSEDSVRVLIAGTAHEPLLTEQGHTGSPRLDGSAPTGHVVNMRVFHTLRLLLDALLDARRIHQVNAAILAEEGGVS